MSATAKHPNSRIVTIFRAGSMLSRSQGAAVDDFFAESKQSIGSYFENKNSALIGTGLEPEELKLVIPEIVKVEPEDREFRKLTNEFYADLTTPVPHGRGINLEVGLKVDNTKPLSKANMPINTMDYVRWRHALGHPWVAETKEQAEGDQTKQYYVFDKAFVQAANSRRGMALDAAMQVFLKIKNDLAVVDQMLALLGTDPHSFVGNKASVDDQKVEALRALTNKDPDKFKTTYDEGDLEIRYMLKTMAAHKVLKQIGPRFLDAETDTVIGNTSEEAIYWFKNDDNSQQVITLKARLQVALEKVPEKKSKRTQLESTK